MPYIGKIFHRNITQKLMQRCTRGIGIGMSLTYQGHVIDGTDVIHASVRQIAHEFLYSVFEDEKFKYIKSIVNYVKKWNS